MRHASLRLPATTVVAGASLMALSCVSATARPAAPEEPVAGPAAEPEAAPEETPVVGGEETARAADAAPAEPPPPPPEPLAIDALEPGWGVIAGHEPVKIRGRGFRPGIGIDVYFGSGKAPAVVVEHERQIVVTTPPAKAPAIVDVRIQTTDGQSLVLRNAFRYVEDQNWALKPG